MKYEVKATKKFNDNPAKTTREKNDVFEVDEKRLGALEKASLVTVVKEVPEQNKEDQSDGGTQVSEPKTDINELADEKSVDPAEEENKVEDNVADPEEDKQEEQTKKDDDTEYPLHVGGPYYLLSNGDQVKGKQDAIDAEKEL